MRIKKTDISPDGVRIVVEWVGFTPGTSIFIPCINIKNAIKQVKDAQELTGYDIEWRVLVENGTYGVRVWRLR